MAEHPGLDIAPQSKDETGEPNCIKCFFQQFASAQNNKVDQGQSSEIVYSTDILPSFVLPQIPPIDFVHVDLFQHPFLSSVANESNHQNNVVISHDSEKHFFLPRFFFAC